jgi:hypothetical protein
MSSSATAFVTVNDLLHAITSNLCKTIYENEYQLMDENKQRRINEEFRKRNVPHEGVRRVDFLCGRFVAKGLVRLEDTYYNVVVEPPQN